MELTEEIIEMIKELEDDEILVIVMESHDNGGRDGQRNKTEESGSEAESG